MINLLIWKLGIMLFNREREHRRGVRSAYRTSKQRRSVCDLGLELQRRGTECTWLSNLWEAKVLEARAFAFDRLMPSALHIIWHTIGLKKLLLCNSISEGMSIKGKDKALKREPYKYTWGTIICKDRQKQRFQKQEQGNIEERKRPREETRLRSQERTQ